MMFRLRRLSSLPVRGPCGEGERSPESRVVPGCTIRDRTWRCTTTLCVAVLSLFFFSSPGLADQSTGADPWTGEDMLFLDIPSVYSASKHEQKVTEAPRAIPVAAPRSVIYDLNTRSADPLKYDFSEDHFQGARQVIR